MMKSGHVHASDIEIENVNEGMNRQILGYLSGLMLVRVTFDKGAIGYTHEHSHQQVSYVESGVFEVEIDGLKKILKAGDAFVIDSDINHGAVCLEKGVLIDTFSPMREDFIAEN